MTAAADAARDALRGSVDTNRQQQALTEESRVLLAAMLRDEMRLAVAEGISAAMTDEAAEKFWNTGLAVLQRQAKTAAGGFVLGGLGALFRRVGLFVLLGGIVYWIGGWSALATFGKFLMGDGK